ncbi:MAG: hypothetical protein ABIF17_03530 [Patescibacteria group bacterium]
MKKFNFEKELKFIHYEKCKNLDKKGTPFELLNILQALLVDYINPENVKKKSFYKMIYCKTKSFYSKQKNVAKIN